MTSRERVRAALERRPVDRVPIFMWFHPRTAARLGRLLEIPAGLVGEAMGNDVRQAWVNNNYAMEGILHERDGEWHRDFWGIKWEKQGDFNQPVEFPLQGSGEAEALAYPFPDGRLEDLLANMDGLVAAPDRAEHYLGCDVSPCLFEMYWRLRGLEQALVDMAACPAFAGRMLERCAAFARRLAEEACRRFPLDWLWTGDDVAGQEGLILSPAAWRELVKPLLAGIFAVGRRAGLPVAYHCCGALAPIIPDLIEIGLDLLNPIQAGCPGMQPRELARRFGARLSFMGGLDTQGVLPFGDEAQVRRHTAELLEAFSGGGYILAASHTIPPETPEANIFALYAEAGVGRQEIFDRAADLRSRRNPERRAAGGGARASGAGL
jgi:uroporphyrinogen decarboxylase